MTLGADAGVQRQLGATKTLRALIDANLCYWPAVAPVVRRELAQWDRSAAEISNPGVRGLAIGKLQDERFNAEVAATLAVLAPRPARVDAVRAIVSLEVLFDYLDGRTELPSSDPIGEGTALFKAFTAPFAPDELAHLPPDARDGAYIRALSEHTRESWLALPSARELTAVAHRCAERCAQAQTRVHAALTLGDGQLEEWAREGSSGNELGWREYVCGSASSVLAVHAIVATAASPLITSEQAERVDGTYMAIGGVVSMLDSLVDWREDMARGEPGLIRLFEADELADRLGALARLARLRAAEAPFADHHVMTLAGVAAYYMTHPGAQEPLARRVLEEVRKELPPVIWPALVVMGSWRKAKGIRALIGRNRV